MLKHWRQIFGVNESKNIKICGGITDSYKGEVFGFVNAVDSDNSKNIGNISYTYTKHDNKIAIQYIKVISEYRRRGIATRMREFLMKEYPGAIIGALGNFLTDEGTEFENSFKK